MALIKKLALGSIFISVLCIFAMSHNVSAVDFSYDLNNYSVNVNLPLPPYNVRANNNLLGVQTGDVAIPYYSGRTYINYFRTQGYFNLKKGDLIEFYVYAYTDQNYILGGGDLALHSDLAIAESSSDVQTVDTTLVASNITNAGSVSSTTNVNNIVESISGYEANRVYNVYRIRQLVLNDIRTTIGLQQIGSYQYPFQFYSQTTANDIPTVYLGFRNLIVYRFAGSEENREVEEKTQEAVDESQSAGSSSSSSASQGGANLLSAITGFFNVITSAQPSNCRFNAPLNTYFGNERLNVDLCSLDLPSGIGALTSIIAIGILIPFAIHMFNKFIALFRSFQS